MRARLIPTDPAGRTLARCVLVNALGKGFFLTGSVVFLTRAVGLGAGQVGFVLTAGAITGLLCGVPVGRLADRRDAGRVLAGAFAVSAVAMVFLGVAASFGVCLVAVAVNAMGQAGASSAQGAVIGRLAGGSDRAVLRAQLRSLTNAGVTIGATAGTLPLALDSAPALRSMMWCDAGSYAVAALLLLRLPALRSAAAGPEVRPAHRWQALHDWPYLAVASVLAVMSVSNQVLTIGLPLWIVDHTRVPSWSIGPILVVNTTAVVALQVRATASLGDPRRAAYAISAAGAAALAGWVTWGFAGAAVPVVGLILCVVGVALHTAAELWLSAAGFELSFGLASSRALGEYQGVFGLCGGIARAAGPVVVTGVAVSHGVWGWMLLGGAMALLGAAAPVTTGWAQRRRADAREPAWT